jgi:hypothetical protein
MAKSDDWIINPAKLPPLSEIVVNWDSMYGPRCNWAECPQYDKEQSQCRVPDRRVSSGGCNIILPAMHKALVEGKPDKGGPR